MHATEVSFYTITCAQTMYFSTKAFKYSISQVNSHKIYEQKKCLDTAEDYQMNGIEVNLKKKSI
jgi:hypothetical protein